MRALKVLNYGSILKVRGEAGCSFCRLMKNIQTALLQEPDREVHHLSSFHAWDLQRPSRQSPLQNNSLLFLRSNLETIQALLAPSAPYCERKRTCQSANLSATPPTNSLDIGYDLRRFPAWKHGAPPAVVSLINTIMESCRRQLIEDFARLHSKYLPDAEKWGLGRAAEFMVSQRGLYT